MSDRREQSTVSEKLWQKLLFRRNNSICSSEQKTCQKISNWRVGIPCFVLALNITHYEGHWIIRNKNIHLHHLNVSRVTIHRLWVGVCCWQVWTLGRGVRGRWGPCAGSGQRAVRTTSAVSVHNASFSRSCSMHVINLLGHKRFLEKGDTLTVGALTPLNHDCFVVWMAGGFQTD